MGEKKSTIDIIKKQREVPAAVRDMVKKYSAFRKKILEALGEGPLTIPEIAERAALPPAEVTYHLMTMRKFGQVEAVDDDDVDEYYSYRIKE